MDYNFYFSTNKYINPTRVLKDIVDDLRVEEPQIDYEMLRFREHY